jgi:diamine N-acetyltransferase
MTNRLDTRVAIRAAMRSDAEALSALASRTFSDAFGNDNTPEDLASFLANTYSPDIQRRELSDLSLQYLVAERDGGLVAYALLREKGSPYVADATALEVQRFYVEQSAHGSGVAQSLMAECVAAARLRGAGSLWLGVWERNARALRFYSTQGFHEVGTQIFTVGSDPQRDVVMLRSLR